MEGSAVDSRMQERELGRVPRTRPEFIPLPEPAGRLAGPDRRWWSDLGLLLALVVFAAGIRLWLIGHTEVAARDSIGFIRYGLELENRPWKDVFAGNLQHPGYPIVLMLVSWPVRFFLGGIDYRSMQLSAQLASSLAGVLLVIPMFFLGRELFHRRAGFWGAFLFQCLPVSSRILSDGLSEATFLLFTTTALLFAVGGMRTGSVLRFALCGLFTGMAYLTRPEGALLLAAAGSVLIGAQFYPRWRRSWGRTLVCGMSLLVAALAVGGPYPYFTGQFTKKPSVIQLMQSNIGGGVVSGEWSGIRSQGSGVRNLQPFPVPTTTHHLLLTSHYSRLTTHYSPPTMGIWAVYAPPQLEDRRLWGLKAIVTEVIKGYHYVIGLPVLVGIWWFRGRLRVVPGGWVLVGLCALHAFVLYRLAVRVGYVSERHVQLLVLCGIFTGAAAVAAFGDWLWLWAARLWSEKGTATLSGTWPAVALFLMLAGLGLPEVLKPLHLNRAGHRDAGLWLAQNALPTDEVIDPNCWAHYYAGRVFLEGKPLPSPRGTTYVVLETNDSDREHSARLPFIEKAKTIARRGKVVYHWPVDSIETQAKILVFAVPPS
jgi:hypothetical protein